MDRFQQQWWEDKQKKKKESIDNDAIHRCNLALVRVIRALKVVINKDDYKEEADVLSRRLAQCNIWDVVYLNNLEDPSVVVKQAILIYTILNRENNPDLMHHQRTVDTMIAQASQIDPTVYSDYNRAKDNLKYLRR